MELREAGQQEPGEVVTPSPAPPTNPEGWRTQWRRKQKRSLKLIAEGKLPPNPKR